MAAPAPRDRDEDLTSDPCDFLEINGNRLRYRLRGEGPLAVFGHGLLGSMDELLRERGTLTRLEQSVQLLLYDARGHGGSHGPADPLGYSWETLGMDMAALVEAHGESPSIVGGASMGAATALWVAIERPELVRGLVLMIPPPLGYERERAAEEKQAIAMLDALAAMIDNFGFDQTIEMLGQWPGFAANEEDRAARKTWLRTQNPNTILHVIRGLLTAEFHDPDRYREIEAPMLVVGHEGDGLHPARAARLLAERAPNSRLVLGPDPGYWQRSPDELAGLMESFLGDLGA